jgi:hypothetical protein
LQISNSEQPGTVDSNLTGKNRPRRAQRWSRGIALLILNFGARRGLVVNTTPRPLYPRERPGTHYTGCWVGPRVGQDVCEKSRPHREFFFLFVSCASLFWYSTFNGCLYRIVPYAVGIFPAGKIRRLRSGANPRSWVPEASMQTPKPPKPLKSLYRPARSQSLYRLSYPAH